MRKLLWTAILLSVTATACGEDAAGPPDRMSNLGIIAWDNVPMAAAATTGTSNWGPDDPGERPPIVAPESVFAGVPFTVSATTLLADGCWDSGPHEVQSGSREATITVHDYWNGSEVCILVAGWSTREVTLVFTEPGEAVIRLVGRRVSGDSATVPGDPMVVEHRVTVYEP